MARSGRGGRKKLNPKTRAKRALKRERRGKLRAKADEMREWKRKELLVQRLEQCIQPDARVLHNQYLPEIGPGGSGSKRQCDVVIRTGPPNRETLTIVEVQKRSTKVGSQDFDSWIQKRELLGAQHLICVSETGYTDPVVKKASKHKGTVEILTLNELENWPWKRLEDLLQLTHTAAVYKKGPDIETTPHREVDMVVGHFDRIFRREKEGPPLHLYDIAQEAFAERGPPGTDGEFTMEIHFFSGPEQCLWVTLDKEELLVKRFSAWVHFEWTSQWVELRSSEYRRIDSDTADAWALTGSASFQGADIEVRLVLVARPNGLVTIRSHELLGAHQESSSRFALVRR